MTLYCSPTAYIKRYKPYNSLLYVSPAKGVVSVMAARVQIPASPLETLQEQRLQGFIVPSQNTTNSSKLPQIATHCLHYCLHYPFCTAYNRVSFFCHIMVKIHHSPVRGVVCTTRFPKYFIHNPNNFALVRTSIT